MGVGNLAGPMQKVRKTNNGTQQQRRATQKKKKKGDCQLATHKAAGGTTYLFLFATLLGKGAARSSSEIKR